MNNTEKESATHHLSVVVTNRSSVPVMFYLEPWGNEYRMQPGSKVQVDFQSSSLQPIPVSYESDSIVVEGWEGAVASAVWLDGELVG